MSDVQFQKAVPVETLLQPETIRSSSKQLLELARLGQLSHFRLHEDKLIDCANFVVAVMQANYPNFEIPYHSRWRHFEMGGVNRIQLFKQKLSTDAIKSWGNLACELVIVSVLLDAGAGLLWSYQDPLTQVIYQRSEGLALASLELYTQGHLSLDPQNPYRVDAKALKNLSKETLEKIFQVTDKNQLEGLEGRLTLLKKLGEVLAFNPKLFPNQRLGDFFNVLRDQAKNFQIQSTTVFNIVLEVLQPIWPVRLIYQSKPLGDVGSHPALKSTIEGSDLIPFHKLSQWLTYSLIEPLESSGIAVLNLDALTGLPEYRNGGLLIDMGVLEIIDQRLVNQPIQAFDEGIVEWRGLTVALLDELAKLIRTQLDCDSTSLPLAKILQGGTWAAGRKIAKQKRPDGAPPIRLESDGTVF